MGAARPVLYPLVYLPLTHRRLADTWLASKRPVCPRRMNMPNSWRISNREFNMYQDAKMAAGLRFDELLSSGRDVPKFYEAPRSKLWGIRPRRIKNGHLYEQS